MHVLVGIHQKYQLDVGGSQEIEPIAEGYVVKVNKTHIAKIQYPSSTSFQVTKDESLSGATFSTTFDIEA